METLRSIRRWTPTLWSLRVSKPAGLRFQPGHYVRLGLGDGADLVWRAYSIVSAPADEELEFLIGLIPGGQFSERLATVAPGDGIRVDAAALGFFLVSQFAPGDDLWMLATGTGLGPYISLLRDGGPLAPWRRLVLVHSVRHAAELAYADEVGAALRTDSRLSYVPIVTRDAGATPLTQRIPALLESGTLEEALGLRLEPAVARVMVCGNPEFTADARRLLTQRQFQPCRRGLSGSMLFENYW